MEINQDSAEISASRGNSQNGWAQQKNSHALLGNAPAQCIRQGVQSMQTIQNRIPQPQSTQRFFATSSTRRDTSIAADPHTAATASSRHPFMRRPSSWAGRAGPAPASGCRRPCERRVAESLALGCRSASQRHNKRAPSWDGYKMRVRSVSAPTPTHRQAQTSAPSAPLSI